PGGVDTDLPGVSQGRVDVIPSVYYEYEQDNASITRESVGEAGASPNDPLPIHHDLKFQQFKHTLTPRLDVGIYHDTFFYAALPIIINQARELRLDKGVDRAGSSTVADGI